MDAQLKHGYSENNFPYCLKFNCWNGTISPMQDSISKLSYFIREFWYFGYNLESSMENTNSINDGQLISKHIKSVMQRVVQKPGLFFPCKGTKLYYIL